jgi:hypothetical protein
MEFNEDGYKTTRVYITFEVLSLLTKPKIRVLKKVTLSYCQRYEGAEESKQWRFFTQLFSLDATNIRDFPSLSRKIYIHERKNPSYYNR